MAKIPVEKESGGSSWLGWLLGLLLLALIIWLLWAWIDDDDVEPVTDTQVEEVTPETQQTMNEPATGAANLGLAAILANPNEYYGDTFPDTEVTVASNREITDRGFWIQNEGNHLFAVIIDVPEEQPKDINPGATLRVTDGTLRQPSYLDNNEMPGRPLDQTTQNIAQQQEIFLVVDERNITVLEQGNPQPGTDPATSVQGGN